MMHKIIILKKYRICPLAFKINKAFNIHMRLTVCSLDDKVIPTVCRDCACVLRI